MRCLAYALALGARLRTGEPPLFADDVYEPMDLIGLPANISSMRSEERSAAARWDWGRPQSTDPEDETCSTVLLTTYFTSKKDWQREKYQNKSSFAYIEKWYKSVRAFPAQDQVSGIVLHDELSDEFVQNYTTPNIRFVKVDMTAYSSDLGLNDIRYLFFRDQLASHPMWDVVFHTDVSDVQLRQNPCKFVYAHGAESLYPGIEPGSLKNPWFADMYAHMGGKYFQWYNDTAKIDVIYNAGVMGGKREVVLKFYEEMARVILDPALYARRHHKQVNVDMGAANFILHHSFGAPLTTEGVTSRFKKFETDRSDVVFIHKGYPVPRSADLPGGLDMEQLRQVSRPRVGQVLRNETEIAKATTSK